VSEEILMRFGTYFRLTRSGYMIYTVHWHGALQTQCDKTRAACTPLYGCFTCNLLLLGWHTQSGVCIHTLEWVYRQQ